MHGGGGGTSNLEFKKLLFDKMTADLQTHYGLSNFPDSYYWPEPVPNAAPPQLYPSNPANPFTYTFCWHAEPEFIVWHRPLTAEFERLLQNYDPLHPGVHEGSNALGLAYWAWENWDGSTLPLLVTCHEYVIRCENWGNEFPAGSVIPNPFRRWFAPVDIKQQEEEYFPPALTDYNCTTRSLSFQDPNVKNIFSWVTDSSKDRNTVSTMSECIQHAMNQKNYYKFATMKSGVGDSRFSIEHAHNAFHNHIGGQTLGGTQGPGVQVWDPHALDQNGKPIQATDFTGTMAQNQSIFDPIFWLHHLNVDRQLCSWQRQHLSIVFVAVITRCLSTTNITTRW